MLIPNMDISGRSFLGRKHAILAPVLSFHLNVPKTKIGFRGEGDLKANRTSEKEGGPKMAIFTGRHLWMTLY